MPSAASPPDDRFRHPNEIKVVTIYSPRKKKRGLRGRTKLVLAAVAPRTLDAGHWLSSPANVTFPKCSRVRAFSARESLPAQLNTS